MVKESNVRFHGARSDNRAIKVRGAREHNLKNINLTIPRDALIVFTGLSGSGKSSLAFDTIYAEGQRRYVESLSSYARQFLEMMQKPDVDLIEGLSPAISIEQKTASCNPRSTVGTVTEIYDYIRLLFSRIGIPHSPATGLPIESQTVTQMVDTIIELDEGERLYLLAPIVKNRKGEFRKDLSELMRRGFQRVKVNGKFYELSEAPKLNKKFKHDIDVVIDRLVVKTDIKTRLADSLETTLELGKGIAIVELADKPFTKSTIKGANKSKNYTHERIIFSSRFACPISGFTIDEIEPRLFSFNSPAGACPSCDGLGTKLQFVPDTIVPNIKLSLLQGAVLPWAKTGSTSPYYEQTLNSIAKHFNVEMTTPWNQLASNVQQTILFGTGTDEIIFTYNDGLRKYQTKKTFEGVIANIERRWRETKSQSVRDELARYQKQCPCKTCNGQRLKPQALCIKIANKNISEICDLSIRQAIIWFDELQKILSSKQMTIAARMLKEIKERLNFLNEVGLDYLTLSRSSATLSGGESQRIRLASQIGSGLTGVLYVLDEPSIGLHQRDNERLLNTLRNLRDLGNTVIVVEHDEDAIRSADFVVDIGPGAGIHGGHIIAQGTPTEIINSDKSLTGKYLSGALNIKVPAQRRVPDTKRQITIRGANGNNLKDVDVAISLGLLTCVTGVSGSGKSTLVIDTMYKAIAQRLLNARETPSPFKNISGVEQLDKVIDINQSPIGRTPRSNPATYTGAFTPIREWFSNLPESKVRGYLPGRFSFNVKGGRCEACHGDGVIKIEMHFLPDVHVTCDQCKGARYNRETLEIKFRNKSIADVLDMTVDDACLFFKAIPAISDKLETLRRVGLGYVKIGQQATTLSGGESQRVKLAKELSRRATGRTLYILDEPTTGLHFHDISKLLEVLHELVNAGNTVVIIEHNLEVIKTADWIIDIGPEGGDGGGKIVAQGTPEEITTKNKSYTGKFLNEILQRYKSKN
ncbi:MAG: UvrABC system protein A [Hyphomicrobiaceae bacterium hypho_1]